MSDKTDVGFDSTIQIEQTCNMKREAFFVGVEMFSVVHQKIHKSRWFIIFKFDLIISHVLCTMKLLLHA